MKFCPNCGFLLEGKIKCSCGFNSEKNEVDEKNYEEWKRKEKSNYERSCNNQSMKVGTFTPLDDSSPIIFNKDNDNLYAKELEKMMKWTTTKKKKNRRTNEKEK